MEALKVSEIVKVVEGILICGDVDQNIYEISTDSRKIEKGCLFVPLIGENFDGHDFIEQSFGKGASVCLTQKDAVCPEGKSLIKVRDTLLAFQAISKYYKQKFDIPFVAVTGSVGKTTTKEMIACVLEQKYKVLKTAGNFNNEIGLPKTLLNLDSSHEIGIVEMGMSGFGEIERLSNIVNPDTAVITNIGVSHIEKLGSQENILKAKLEVTSGMTDEGNIVLNADDSFLTDAEVSIKNKYYCGINSKKGLYPYNIESLGELGSKFDVKINDKEYKIEVPVPGEHNIYNSMVAVQVGLIYNIPVEDIIKGIKSFVPGGMRQNIIKLENGTKIIEDCYNASPQSMKASISVLESFGGNRKIAVLGDMLEMGDYAAEGHSQVGQFAAEKGVDFLFILGSYSEFVKQGAVKEGMNEENIFCFDEITKLSEKLKKFIKEKDVILVKGSRGMKMEHIVSSICEVK